MKFPCKDITPLFSQFDMLYGSNSYDYQSKRYLESFEKFKQIFGCDSCYVASSSGRVEVLGNHTDHNGGMVISSAISLDTLAFFLPNPDDKIRIYSEGYPEFSVDIKNFTKEGKPDSSFLVAGVFCGLQNMGYNIGGFNAYITSNVPDGAGVSSSASFEVLIAKILSFLYNNDEIAPSDLAKVSQYSENVYFNKPCGLLDQSAIAFGGVKLLDFSCENEIIVKNCEINTEEFSFILVSTGGSHANLTDEYASIPAEMKAVANLFNKTRLIDVSLGDILSNYKDIVLKTSDRAFLRAVHFFTENQRVENARFSLKDGDINLFIKQVNESGLSSQCNLQNCYVSSSKEQPINRTLAIIKNIIEDGAVRVHGGGFAGCVLCVVKKSNLNAFLDNLHKYFDENSIYLLSVRKCGAIVL